MGLLALACIGVAAFAWQSNHGQVASEPTSTSSVSIEKREQPAQPAPYNADVAAKTEVGLPQPSSQAQTTLQRAAPVAPTAAPMAPDLAQSIQMIARELANVEQGIDQLKTGQAQMVRDNAELAEHLEATQEMARHNANLAEDLTAAQAQMAHHQGQKLKSSMRAYVFPSASNNGHRSIRSAGPFRANIGSRGPYPITSSPRGEKSRRHHDAERSDCLQISLIGQSSLNARIQKFSSKFGRSHPAWGDVVGTAPLGAQTSAFCHQFLCVC